ncbi:MAG: hypothetical protein KGL69_12995, partial [Alphaproteobacteria bacterium]|nr:hypothetical protein [Alphaproteobacteria bacterium]
MASPGRRIEAGFGPGGVDVAPAAGPFDPVAIGFALLAFGVHAALAGRYDVFRDELYFIVC